MGDGVFIRSDVRPSNLALNALFTAAWGHIIDRDHQPVLDRSLGFVCAMHEDALVGFVNVAWDGGQHAFILDTCVAPDFQRQGIATALVKQAVPMAKSRGVVGLHVDFEPHLSAFYEGCGFRPSAAGVMDLRG